MNLKMINHDILNDPPKDEAGTKALSTLPQSDSILSFMDQINAIEADIDDQKIAFTQRNEAMRIV